MLETVPHGSEGGGGGRNDLARGRPNLCSLFGQQLRLGVGRHENGQIANKERHHGKAGGIIGIVAGIFGVIAAVITLSVGGIGSAFEAEGAKTIVTLVGVGCSSRS